MMEGKAEDGGERIHKVGTVGSHNCGVYTQEIMFPESRGAPNINNFCKKKEKK